MDGLWFVGVFCFLVGLVVGCCISNADKPDVPREKRGVPKMENPPPMPKKPEAKVPDWEPGSFIDMNERLHEKRRRIFHVAHGSPEYEALTIEIISLVAKMKETESLPKMY